MQIFSNHHKPNPEKPRAKSIVIEQNDNYNGLYSNSKNSRFSSLFIDPIYKFPSISNIVISSLLNESDCYLADFVKISKFFANLHENSPFRLGSSLDIKNTTIIEIANSGVPQNSIRNNDSESLSFASIDKSFNLAEEMANEYVSISSSSRSLALSSSPEKQDVSINSREGRIKFKNFLTKHEAAHLILLTCHKPRIR